MDLLVAYDVDTATREGKRRLRKVAKLCEEYGQRVQYSVFEITLGDAAYLRFVSSLQEILAAQDNVRLYELDRGTFSRVRHFGPHRHLSESESWVL